MAYPNLTEALAEQSPMEDDCADQSLGQITDSDSSKSTSDQAHHTTNSSTVEADGEGGESNPRPVSEASVSSNSSSNLFFPAYSFFDMMKEGMLEYMGPDYSMGRYEALPLDDSDYERNEAPVLKKGKGKEKEGKEKMSVMAALDKGKGKDTEGKGESPAMVNAKGKGKAKAPQQAKEEIDEGEDGDDDSGSDASTIKASAHPNTLNLRSTIGVMTNVFGAKDDVGSSHLQPLPEHVINCKQPEELTQEEYHLFMADFYRKVREGKLVRPRVYPRLLVGRGRSFTATLP